MTLIWSSLAVVGAFIAGAIVVVVADERMEARLERSWGADEQAALRRACERTKTIGLHIVQGCALVAIAVVSLTSVA